MSFFNSFRKEKKPPKEVIKVFDGMKAQMEGRKLADEALSYRNLGEYEKAYRLLMDSVEKYHYLPAITLIGTTALLKGDIEKAIEWFEVNIKNPPMGSGYLIIEWYANLGLIYFQKKKDIEKARNAYEKALSIPKPTGIDDGLYNLIISGVHRDIAAVYFMCGQISLADEYARKRLAFNPDCEIGKKVLDACEKHSFKIRNAPKLINAPQCGTVTFSSEGKATFITSGGRDFPSGGQRLTHGMGHQLLHLLYTMREKALPQYREQCERDIAYIEQWAGVVNEKWSFDQDERFARQYELFVSMNVPEMRLQSPRGEPLDRGLSDIFKRVSGK